jgi:hypothetical protein
MAYEKPIPLPGLPPPAPSDEQLVAETGEGADGFDPGASGRLAAETSAALGRLEERFKKASTPPLRQAALEGASVGP